MQNNIQDVCDNNLSHKRKYKNEELEEKEEEQQPKQQLEQDKQTLIIVKEKKTKKDLLIDDSDYPSSLLEFYQDKNRHQNNKQESIKEIKQALLDYDYLKSSFDTRVDIIRQRLNQCINNHLISMEQLRLNQYKFENSIGDSWNSDLSIQSNVRELFSWTISKPLCDQILLPMWFRVKNINQTCSLTEVPLTVGWSLEEIYQNKLKHSTLSISSSSSSSIDENNIKEDKLHDHNNKDIKISDSTTLNDPLVFNKLMKKNLTISNVEINSDEVIYHISSLVTGSGIKQFVFNCSTMTYKKKENKTIRSGKLIRELRLVPTPSVYVERNLPLDWYYPWNNRPYPFRLTTEYDQNPLLVLLPHSNANFLQYTKMFLQDLTSDQTKNIKELYVYQLQNLTLKKNYEHCLNTIAAEMNLKNEENINPEFKPSLPFFNDPVQSDLSITNELKNKDEINTERNKEINNEEQQIKTIKKHIMILDNNNNEVEEDEYDPNYNNDYNEDSDDKEENEEEEKKEEKKEEEYKEDSNNQNLSFTLPSLDDEGPYSLINPNLISNTISNNKDNKQQVPTAYGFHGTASTNIESICRFGLQRINEVTGTKTRHDRWGCGIYMARQSYMAVKEYCPVDKFGFRTCLILKMALGRTEVGIAKQVGPSKFDAQRGLLYHSTTDHDMRDQRKLYMAWNPQQIEIKAIIVFK